MVSDRLEARYRRLLLGYPRDYRRERGQEIVDTLLELAPDGQTRPTVRQAVNLLRNGLRCRLGRPASRSIVVWASLTAVVWGLFIAAVAERITWETARPLPSAAQTTATLAPLLPGEEFGPVATSTALFGFDDNTPMGWQEVPRLLLGGGIDYGPRHAGVMVRNPAGPNRSADRLIARLQANGWQVDTPWVRRTGECAPPDCMPARPVIGTMITARRESDVLTIDIQPEVPRGDAWLDVRIGRAAPALTVPAGIAGGVAGATAVWMLFGWLSRRLERLGHMPRAFAYVLGVWALILWYLPIVFFVPIGILGLLSNPSGASGGDQLWTWLGQPIGLLPFVVGTGLALVLVALPVPWRHMRAQEPVRDVNMADRSRLFP